MWRPFPNGHLTLGDRLRMRKRRPTDFGPGITAVGVLSESHIAVHTTPQKSTMYVDVFSCRPFKVNAVQMLIDTYFGMIECSEWRVVLRPGVGKEQ